MQDNHGDPHPPAGVVELREDVPLKAGGAGAGAGWGGAARCCVGGPRLIIACFAALTAAITLALFTQIYYGDYEVVPHGSVSSSFAACSRAGTDALKAGGRALDAAAAAALCLAVAAPHRSSLDASGAMIYWEYRQLRTQKPILAEWGGVPLQAGADGAVRPPRLVAALASLHAEYGALPWSRLLQPAIDLARDGFLVSEGLALALAAETTGEAKPPPVNSLSTAPQLAAYLETLQLNTSAELSAAWGGTSVVRKSSPSVAPAGASRVYAGGADTAEALHALTLALDPPPVNLDDASRRVVAALQLAAAAKATNADGVGESIATAESVATGLAVVDRFDTYVALVTGLSIPFGSGPATAAGWTRDEPQRALDLAPAIMVDTHVCGTRYVMGAESSAALVQVAAALGAGGGAAAVERARVAVRRDGSLAAEPLRATAAPALASASVPALNATPPYSAVNLVQQSADALLSHADSRGGGLASRF